MKYDMSSKLKFAEAPKLKVTDKVEVTVRNDAETVLTMMGMVATDGDTTSYMTMIGEAGELLFSEKDFAKIKKLGLTIEDYMAVIETAISLSLGEDPDADQEQTGEE